MSNEINSEMDPGQPMIYQIRIKGHLGHEWTDWFEGLTITNLDNGETLLTGPVVDQAALYGLLRKVRDVGVPLLSVNRVTPQEAEAKARQWNASKSFNKGVKHEDIQKDRHHGGSPLHYWDGDRCAQHGVDKTSSR